MTWTPIILGFALVAAVFLRNVQGSTLWIDRDRFPEYVPEFWRRFARYLRPIFAVVLPGYDPIAVASIIAWETGYLSDPNARRRVVEYNNIMGIEPSGRPAVFRSIAEGVKYFDYMMHLKPDTRGIYREAYQVRHDGEKFLQALHDAGYNSSQSWIDGVLSIYRR
jgi:hypothetical protein